MKFLIFLGTVRDSTPPRPARLGKRVANASLACLQTHHGEHEFEIIDALDYPLTPVFKPHFAYAKTHRAKVDPQTIGHFQRNPLQRNAP